jgi:hypothetical protein
VRPSDPLVGRLAPVRQPTLAGDATVTCPEPDRVAWGRAAEAGPAPGSEAWVPVAAAAAGTDRAVEARSACPAHAPARVRANAGERFGSPRCAGLRSTGVGAPARAARPRTAHARRYIPLAPGRAYDVASPLVLAGRPARSTTKVGICACGRWQRLACPPRVSGCVGSGTGHPWPPGCATSSAVRGWPRKGGTR